MIPTLVEMKDTIQAVRACWVVSSRDWILEMKRSLLLQVTATPSISLRNLATTVVNILQIVDKIYEWPTVSLFR